MARIQFPHRSSALTASFSVRHRQTSPLSYPVRQRDHVCRVDAEEDVTDFRQLRPGLDPSEIVVLFLGPERATHRSRPHSGKFLSDKVFLLLLLTERMASFHEKCQYPVRLAAIPVFSSRIARISSDYFRVDQYVVDLRSELDALHLLAPHYRSQMWLAETHYPDELALFPVCQVRLLHVKELRPWMVDAQSAAQLTGSGCCSSAVPAVSDS